MQDIALGMNYNQNIFITDVQSLALDVNEGDDFYIDIGVQNDSGASIVKDFGAGFGTYDEIEQKFYISWGHVKQDVQIITGASTTTVTSQASGNGLYDCVAGFGVYDTNGRMNFEGYKIIIGALNVIGVGVSAVRLS